MSIASELSELSANKAAIKAAIEAKNPTTPPTAALAQWPTAIASIPGPKPEQSKTVTPTAAGLTVTPDSGKVLNSVVVNGDADLVAGNVKKDVTIFGVTGTYEGSGGGAAYAVCFPRDIPSNGDGFDVGYGSIIVDGVDYSRPTSRPAVVKRSAPFQISISDDFGTAYIDLLKPDGTTVRVNSGTPATVNDVMMCVYLQCECLLRGTMVLLSDGTEKPIEEIGYDDELLVWDFERGETALARPLWIKRAATTNFRYVAKFASGRSLEMTGINGHRAFNCTLGRFEYLPRSVGDIVQAVDGLDHVVECRREMGDFEYYNIITHGHFNLFANGILTSCRLNNYHAFDVDTMKWASPAVVHHQRSDFSGLPENWIDGLHLCEQPTATEEIVGYVKRLVRDAMPRSKYYP